MKQNETFKNLIERNRPELGDSEEYMDNLQRKLAAVEVVRKMYETENRRMRNRVIVAFVSGILAGAGTALYLILHPDFLAHSRLLPMLDGFQYRMLVSVVAVAIFGGILCTLLYQIVAKDFSEVDSSYICKRTE